MKKIILIIAALTALSMSNAFAGSFDNKPGFYIGLQVGSANANYTRSWFRSAFKHSPIAINSIGGVDNSGVAARIYFGYDFNQYLAAEIGAVGTPDIQFKNITVNMNNQTMNESFSQVGTSILAKAKLPLKYGFTANIKGGVGYITLGNITVTGNGVKYKSKAQSTYVVPVAGAGLSYNITQHFLANATYIRYFAVNDVRSLNFIGLGLAYKWDV